MPVYYIDFLNGAPDADGLTPDTARSVYTDLPVAPGDTVCFRRGGFIRDQLHIVGGAAGAPVTYTAWGEGEPPVFCGSADVSSPDLWTEEKPHVWRLEEETVFDVGNFIFNGDECTASFRWTEEELCAQGDFYDADAGKRRADARRVLMWSEINPGLYYRRIEAAPYGNRVLGVTTSHIVLDGLRFENSGVHALAGQGEDITIRNCVFRHIGGCAWSVPLRIRFGNAIEFWNFGDHVLIEHNDVKDVYDSCVTHQGDRAVIPAHDFICRGNRFDTYGMAAFEYRDRMQVGGVFEDNVCLRAGCGFAMLGEVLPRRSEIWPQPMGHHVFLWRIDGGTEGGSLVLRRNVFGSAPVGAAIYSIISPAAEAQMTVEDNRYAESNPVLLNRFGGVDYPDLASFCAATGREAHGTVLPRSDAEKL